MVNSPHVFWLKVPINWLRFKIRHFWIKKIFIFFFFKKKKKKKKKLKKKKKKTLKMITNVISQDKRSIVVGEKDIDFEYSPEKMMLSMSVYIGLSY